jgi:L-lactate utilization protein LutC
MAFGDSGNLNTDTGKTPTGGTGVLTRPAPRDRIKQNLIPRNRGTSNRPVAPRAPDLDANIKDWERPRSYEIMKNVDTMLSQTRFSAVSAYYDSKGKAFNFNPVNTNELESCDASITLCESLVARTGTIVLSSQQLSGRTASVYAPIHICIAYTHQLVFDISDSLNRFTAQSNAIPSMISFATGPSRTADIEKTLVVGVHGPKEVYCFLVDKLTD